MAYGFSTTFGTASTDQVVTTYTGDATQQTWSIWANRHGGGGSNGGRFFDKRTGAASEFALFNSEVNTQYRFTANWTAAGQWAWANTALDTWFNIIIQYDNSSTANTPEAWFNGISQTRTLNTQPTGSFITNSDAYVLGNVVSVRVWDGMLAEFAVWSRFLTASEIAALGGGYSPLFFRESLMEYVPLVRDPISYKNAAPTVTGALVQPHPRIIYPSTRVKGLRTFVPVLPIFTNWQGVFQRVA